MSNDLINLSSIRVVFFSGKKIPGRRNLLKKTNGLLLSYVFRVNELLKKP